MASEALDVNEQLRLEDKLAILLESMQSYSMGSELNTSRQRARHLLRELDWWGYGIVKR